MSLQHEQASLTMFDHLIEKNVLELKKVKDWEVLLEEKDFIKELIVGKQADADQPKRTVCTLTLPTDGLVLSQQTGWYNETL